MPEETKAAPGRQVRMRHLNRRGQIGVYLGKLLRMFLYQHDWKVLPMSALIAGLVGMVIAGRFHEFMEGTLMSALAITCACLWNGCFNSIQVICRERGVIKREHRSGLHVSSYILAHMLYQALLCLAQAGISLYVYRLIGVSFPARGVVIPSFDVEFFISMFLVTYAADMLALFVSAFARTTTTAMTIMPVVLIFLLVFSGGMMTLPERFEPIQDFTISSCGLKLITAQSDYNNLPLATPWNSVWGMRGDKLNVSFTVGQLLDLLGESDNRSIREVRETKLGDEGTPLADYTIGDVTDMLRRDELAQPVRDRQIDVDTTLGELIDLVGAENVRSYILHTTSAAAYKEDYAYTRDNILSYWTQLLIFCGVFAGMATLTLEFIDRDKR